MTSLALNNWALVSVNASCILLTSVVLATKVRNGNEYILKGIGIISSNRKEGNDQEPIQLPNIFRPRHQRERRTHLKQRHRNQNTTSRKPKGQFLSQKLAKRLSKIQITPGHTCIDIQ